MKIVIVVLLWISVLSQPVYAAPKSLEVLSIGSQQAQLELVAEGLGVPWGMSFLSAEQLLVTDRSGRLLLMDLQTGEHQQVTGLPDIHVRGQAGLLDIQRLPQKGGRDWLYFTYSKQHQGKGVTVLARAQLEGTQLQQWQDLLVTRSASSTGRHFGSRIAFDGQGHVFFSIGDRGERPNGQDLKTHAGSILRLNLDGSVPEDNPFVGQAGVLPEIWSYGHRNPQGLVFDNQHQRLWSIEHGPRGGDEVNLIEKSGNYGWPVVSHGKEYWGPFSVGEGTEKPGMISPLKVYTPSIAPGSLLFYSADTLAAWKGSLFSGALKLLHLNRLILDEQGQIVAEERLLEHLKERIRSLAQSPEGWLYIGTDSGKLFRIRPYAKPGIASKTE